MARKAASDEIEDLEMDEDFDVEEEEETPAKSKAKSAPKGIGASQLAAALPGDVDPKTFRAWLRRKVEAGDIELEHDPKGRYNFGNTINSPKAKQIIKAWNSESHEKGAGLKKAQEAKKEKAKAKAK